MKKLILASASPRRCLLLEQLGLKYCQKISNVREDFNHNLKAVQYVKHLALIKAKDVAQEVGEGIVIGADTVVVHRGRILGKPADIKDAEEMLKMLSGNAHFVLSGLALVDAGTGRHKAEHELTKVYFRTLTADEIKKYISTGEPMDKAGSYAIQGVGAILVERIEGCYNNVVGLPTARLVCMLHDFGVDVWESMGRKK